MADLRSFAEARIADLEAQLARARAGAEAARFSNFDRYANHLPGIRQIEAELDVLRQLLTDFDAAAH
jgi:hypothetical protein